MDHEGRRRIAERLRSRRRAVAEEVTDAFLQRHPDWLERYGALARTRGEEDAAFHVDFLAGAVVAGGAAAFQDYARWTRGVLAARGIASHFLADNLEQVRGAVSADLDEAERRVVDRIVAAGVAAVQAPFEPEMGVAAAGGALRTERSLYLQALRSGRRGAALAVALEAVRAGIPVPDVLGDILQPAQYEIGRLWERNEITVAQEHTATAITQYVVAQLYTHLAVPEETRGNAVITGVRGELHQLGANMVADVLEADGWNVRFLGTQLPHLTVPGSDHEALERHFRQRSGLVAVRHEAYEVLMDSRADPEWLGEGSG